MTENFTWSPQQSAALKAVDKWIKDFYKNGRKQIYYLAGYAGTGKTTLAKHFAQSINGDVAYGAYTGKAALMMARKGCAGASTIHSLIYFTEINRTTGEISVRLNKSTSPIKTSKLVIIDECSMVDYEIAKDLLSFRKPILVLGDPAQLPPPSGAGFFTNLKPDTMLTEIHRQAAENPIIYLATQAREGKFPKLGKYGDSLVTNDVDPELVISSDQILAGRNSTRKSINTFMREIKGYNPKSPVTDDKIVCLRNNHDLGIYNGGIFKVLESRELSNLFSLKIQPEDATNIVSVRVHKSFFIDVPKPDWQIIKGTEEFDYGYALTTHKSQGSQWNNVALYDESWCFREDWKKWLYTGITRAAERITIIKS